MSFLGLIFRTIGAWGAGKGSNLTAAEVDGNFYAIDQYLADLDDNPPTAVSVSNITQSGSGSNITIWLSNGSSYGPFSLPTATPLVTVKEIMDGTYTLLLEDRGRYLRCTNDDTDGGCQVTIPTDAELDIPIGTEYYFEQAASQQVTFDGGTDITLNVESGFAAETRAQFTWAMIKKVAADEWIIGGALATA